jgi:hypothetical protein
MRHRIRATSPKVKQWYSRFQKCKKALMAEFWMGTFVISTNLLNFLENSSLRIFLTCDKSFFISFPELLMLLMGGNLLSFSLRRFPSNSYKDSGCNLYSIKVIFLMEVVLSVQNPTRQDAQS